MSPGAPLRALFAALDDDALEAAASRGLLRRAHRDRAAGLVALADETATQLTFAADGETVRLGTGGLAAARCSCPARGACRHVLAAVIALRDTPPDAAGADPAKDPVAEIVALPDAALVEAFGRPALREADAILAKAGGTGEALAVTVRGRSCILRLPGQPGVRYIAGLGPAAMISKEPAPQPDARFKGRPVAAAALQAASVLALRRREAGATALAAEADATAATQRKPRAEADLAPFLDAVAAALGEAARWSLSGAPLRVEARLLDLALSSRADALPRLAAQLRAVAGDMRRRRERVADFERRRH